MSEQDTQAEHGQSQQQQVSVRSLYLKDTSFESPNAPEIFRQGTQPKVEVNIGVNTQSLGEDHYEVVLIVTVTAKTGDKTAFLTEVHQAGIFLLRGFAREHLGAMLGVYCPNVLFPYAREVVSNLVGKGGFPPIMLEPVNFDALYADHLRQQEEGAPEQEPSSSH